MQFAPGCMDVFKSYVYSTYIIHVFCLAVEHNKLFLKYLSWLAHFLGSKNHLSVFRPNMTQQLLARYKAILPCCLSLRLFGQPRLLQAMCGNPYTFTCDYHGDEAVSVFCFVAFGNFSFLRTLFLMLFVLCLRRLMFMFINLHHRRIFTPRLCTRVSF